MTRDKRKNLFALITLLALTFLIFHPTMTHAADDQSAERFNWQTLPGLPQPSGGQMAGVSNNTLLVIGGSYFKVPVWDGGTKLWLDTVYALEPGVKEWKLAGRLAHPLAYGGAVTVDDGVIVIGGSDGNQHYADVFKLRYVNGKLEQTALPALPQGSANFGAALLGKTIYVAGGQSAPASTEAMKTLWALDLNEREPKWKTLEPLPGASRILPVVAAQAGALFLISGAELSAGRTAKPRAVT
ncbi:MAG: hypothetical protein ACREEM_42425 [Blastocatellia bacterium]